MAAVTSPARVAAQHQSLLHFVGQAPWSDEKVLTKVRDLVAPAMERNLFGLTISQSGLMNMLRRAKVVASDETGVRIEGSNSFHWVFRCADAVVHLARDVGHVLEGDDAAVALLQTVSA